MPKTFHRGGIHPPDMKISAGSAIEVLPLPETVVIPLSQHIGAPAIPVVAKGDTVAAGQLIGKASGFVSANVHSSVSGTITSVDNAPDGGGVRRPAVTIRVEGDQWLEGIERDAAVARTDGFTAEEIIAAVTDAGIVGMGGATFPTHVKLGVPAGKKAEFLIINGAECEPYLTSDHRVMLERTQEVVAGAQLLARALGAAKIFIGIERNKPDVIAAVRERSAATGVEVAELKTKYPQGGEKQLIAAVTGRQVPSGGLPIDAGAVVHNTGTALAVYEAVAFGKPLVERVVTVTGRGIAMPKNLLVRIGTPVSFLIEYCGGMQGSAGKIINGGPMMGRAMSNPDAPVTKGTSGIVVMDVAESRRGEAQACIKCAKCVRVCPMGLEPYMLYRLASRNMFAEAERYYAADCIECGSCSYTCPASLPLLDYIRLGKAQVMKIKRERKA